MTNDPCQFPSAIPQRLIRALTSKNGIVLDPFMGSGTTALAAFIEGRKFIGAEIQDNYYDISVNRIKGALKGYIKLRDDVPVMKPNTKTAVAKLPEEFRIARECKNEEN